MYLQSPAEGVPVFRVADSIFSDLFTVMFRSSFDTKQGLTKCKACAIGTEESAIIVFHYTAVQ